jgi:hypothetical protein
MVDGERTSLDSAQSDRRARAERVTGVGYRSRLGLAGSLGLWEEDEDGEKEELWKSKRRGRGKEGRLSMWNSPKSLGNGTAADSRPTTGNNRAEGIKTRKGR